MKIGLMLPTMQSVELNEQVMQAAEQMGVDDLWMPDHLLGIMHPALWAEFGASAQIFDSDAWLDPFCLAAVLGRQTGKTLGVCVTDATRRRAPDLARTALTLHNNCRGGFVLCIGAGEAESLLPFGYDFSHPVGRLEEVLIELRSLLDVGHMPGNVVGRMGLHSKNTGGVPALWVAGIGNRALSLAGRHGDGWISTGAMTPDDFVRMRLCVQQAAIEAKRPPPVSVLFPMVMLGDSRDQLMALVEERPLVKLLTLFGTASLWRRHGMEHPAGPTCRGVPDVIPHAFDPQFLRQLSRQIPFALLEEFLILGSAEDIAAQLRPLIKAGVDHIILADLTAIAHEPQETVRLMGEMMKLITLLRK